MRGALCIALTGLAIGGMFLASPYRRQTEPAQAQAAPCRQADIYNAVTMRGKTEALRKSRVYAPWTAAVKELYVRQGDQVAQGDPLALLEPADPGQGADWTAEQLAGQLTLQAAQGRLDPEETDQIAQAFAAALEPRREAKGPLVLTAPIDGLVMEVYCGEGETISPLAPCALVGDMNCIAVRAQVGEENLHKISPGMEAEIAIEAFPGQELTGRVESIAPYAQSASILNQDSQIVTDVLVSVENGQGNLRPGYSASVSVKTQRKEQALLLPYDYVGQDEQNREYVMTVWQGRARKKLVATGLELEETVEIEAGLEPGELALRNPEQFYHGQRIEWEAADENP